MTYMFEQKMVLEEIKGKIDKNKFFSYKINQKMKMRIKVIKNLLKRKGVVRKILERLIRRI